VQEQWLSAGSNVELLAQQVLCDAALVGQGLHLAVQGEGPQALLQRLPADVACHLLELAQQYSCCVVCVQQQCLFADSNVELLAQQVGFDAAALVGQPFGVVCCACLEAVVCVDKQELSAGSNLELLAQQVRFDAALVGQSLWLAGFQPVVSCVCVQEQWLSAGSNVQLLAQQVGRRYIAVFRQMYVSVCAVWCAAAAWSCWRSRCA
jgi:hypothetical protein